MHPRHCDILRLLKSLQQKKNRFKLYSTEWIWININDACLDYSMFHGSPAVTSRRCPEGRTHLWGRLPTRPTSPRRSRLGWPQCSSKSSMHRCSTLQPRPNTSVHTHYCWPRVGRSSGTCISQCDWLHRICVSLQCRACVILTIIFCVTML